MGRPSITGESIVVAIDDDLLVWTDGLLSGTNRELIKEAEWLARYEVPVDITPFGPTVIANLTNLSIPEGVVGAMMGAAPGRGRIIQAPQSVIDLLPFDGEETDGTDVTSDSNNEEEITPEKE